MRDQRRVHRPGRVDVETAGRAAQAGGRRQQQVFGAHARIDRAPQPCGLWSRPRRHSKATLTRVTLFEPHRRCRPVAGTVRALVRARGWAPRAHQLELLAKARAGRSALLIAPTGAGKTLAGFLPTLVELSAPVSRHGRFPHAAAGGGGGDLLNRIAVSSPPAATCAAKAGCTRSTSRRSRRWRSTSRATSRRRSPRWGCRSASRPAPATRRPRSASASAAIRPTSC